MEYQYKNDYTGLSDKQLVERILAQHDDEAAAYLLFDRYSNLLHELYFKLTKSDQWYDDCADELFVHLRGKDGSWRAFAKFEWRSTLGYWLKKVVWKKFKEVLSKVKDKGGVKESLDDVHIKTDTRLSSGGEDSCALHMDMVKLVENIAILDEDTQFAVIKHIEGFDGKEIAKLLDMKWKKYGIVKYYGNKVVVPSDGYINNLISRARKVLKMKIVD